MRLFLALAAALAFGLPSMAMAAPPPPLGVEAYGRMPNIELMQLSPSGARVAYIVVTADQRRLVVKDMADAVLFNAPVADNKIRAIDWAGDDHILITATVTHDFFGGRFEFAETVAVNLTSRKSFIVFGVTDSVMHNTFGYYGAVNRDGHWYGYFGGLTLSKSRGFDATFNSDSYADLYRVDLDTNAAVIAASGRQREHRWALDAAGNVIASSEYEERTGAWTLRTGSAGASVATITQPYGEVELMGPGRTPGSVWVAKAIPEEWTLDGGAHAPLVPDRLIEGYMHDPATLRAVGVTLSGDRTEQLFFEPALKARQASLRKALGDSVSLVSWSSDFKRLVVYTDGDGDAGTWWLIDGAAAKAYGYSYPEIPDANVGVSRAIAYKAADGLEMRGILTLPPGRDAKSLPLVVLPHGGPQGHDSLGFDWLAQAFAGRGYAVFQPNFRGSDGQGVEFRDAGFGQWGRKMQTDISDGVAELARQGIIDPKRACIVGASYGGYAALAGVTVQHGLYRCAVSYAGLSDLNYLLNHEVPDDHNAASRYLRKFLGAQSNDDAALHEISPARLADRADAPILLIHGADDTVVPIGQSREMERQLRAAGKPVEFVELKSEDHGLSRDATRKAMLAAAVAFVEKYNPAQ